MPDHSDQYTVRRKTEQYSNFSSAKEKEYLADAHC